MSLSYTDVEIGTYWDATERGLNESIDIINSLERHWQPMCYIRCIQMTLQQELGMKRRLEHESEQVLAGADIQ